MCCLTKCSKNTRTEREVLKWFRDSEESGVVIHMIKEVNDEMGNKKNNAR